MTKLYSISLKTLAAALLLPGLALAQQSTTSTPAASSSSGSTAKSQSAPSGIAPKTTTAKPGQKPAPKTGAPLTLKTQKEKQSYAIGVNVAKGLQQNLQKDEVEIDPAILLRGIKDALFNNKPLLTDQEAQASLMVLETEVRKKREELHKKQEEEIQALAVKNKTEGEAFFATNKLKDGVVTLPDGLEYKVLQAGTGPKPTADDTVVCNYRGTLVNGTEFDSSYKRGQPATFKVSEVIKGWTEAVQLMPVGSKWQLYIPSELAYGQQGAGRGLIGPNATLIFDVELLSIQPKPATVAAPAAEPNPANAPAQPSQPAQPNQPNDAKPQ